MITLQKIGDAIKFTFSGNTHYLQDGTVEVPVNSLSLTIDDSGMATFRKSASNDIFISATYGELGMSKEELVSWYKENMVDGGGSDITSGDVQSMIDESISGKADSSAVTEEISAAVSGKQDTLIAGENITISGNVISAEGGSDINVVQTTGTSTADVMSQDAVTIQLNNKLASVMYNDASWAGSGITILQDSNNSSSFRTITFVGSINNKPILTGKDYTKVYNFNLVETSAITSAITSGSTDAQVPSAKAVYDALQEGGGNNVVELTQAEYDALVSGGTVDPTAFYIITDATPIDLSNYYTSAQTNNAINAAVSGKVDTSTFNTYSGSVDTALNGKQDTLSAGTGIDITDNVISATGGGGKAIEAGRGISVATGETADTVSFNLPISAGTGTNALIIASDTYNLNNKATGGYAVSLNGGSAHPNYATGNHSLAEGADTRAYGECCHTEGHSTSAGTNSFPYTSNAHAEGEYTYAAGYYSHAEGYYTKASGTSSHAEGYSTTANNQSEHASGQYNNSVSASTTFGDSGNTLFSVGNGTADDARHNAFEIRQNGDIYCSDGANDVKLQDTITATTANTTALGGLKLVKLTESEYTALVTKDSDTLYVVVPDA